MQCIKEFLERMHLDINVTLLIVSNLIVFCGNDKYDFILGVISNYDKTVDSDNFH